jgi:AcrR family transcriptional regulator
VRQQAGGKEQDMPRRHGWSGSLPANEDEARARIIDSAMRCVDANGVAEFSLSDVANELGITRQTVYRYFPSADELFAAVGQFAVASFIDDLSCHLDTYHEPGAWAVEAIATAIEWLPSRPYLTLLLATGNTALYSEGITSDVSIEFSKAVVEKSNVDWHAAGYDQGQLDELVEYMLRILQSLLINPPRPERTGRELRRFLTRWIAPAIATVSRA